MRTKVVFGVQRRVWTAKEDNLLRKYYPTRTVKELSNMLHRTEGAIKHRVYRLGVRKNNWIVNEICMNDREIGYVAASLDGEGSLTIIKRWHYDRRKKKPRYRRLYLLPEIRIRNTCRPFLEKLQRIMGGRIFDVKKANRRWKKSYDLVINYIASVYPTLKQVLPELVVKKEQARIILSFCERRLKRELQNSPYTKLDYEAYSKIRELNKRGASSPSG